MLVDHLFQFRISLWPKTAKKRGFCTCVTDGRLDQRTDGRTNGRTDRPSFTDARTHRKRMEQENKHMKKRFRRTRIRDALGESDENRVSDKFIQTDTERQCGR